MGNNCGTDQIPAPVNMCVSEVGTVSASVPGFCTLRGIGGESYSDSVCAQASTAGEWGYNGEGSDCHYDDCHPYRYTPSGCCGGCCAITGIGATCKRLKFTGNPLLCCFNDMACAGVDPLLNPPECYSDLSGGQYTCDPAYRSLSSTGCQQQMEAYCLGTDGSPDWLERWTPDGSTGGICAHAVYRTISNGCTDPIIVDPQNYCIPNLETPITSEGFFWAQSLIAQAFIKFIDEGGIVGVLPGFPGFNPWQSFMHNNICCPFPALCQGPLQTICQNKSTQLLSTNPSLAAWCGCNLPLEEYEQYSVLFNIPPQCAPICNRSGVIPQVGNGGVPILCEQNICLIDGVTINLINSQIAGGINFNQICSGCQGSQCSCIVSDTTIDIQNSTIGGNFVPVAEGCGSSTCYQTNTTTIGPNRIPVPCSSGTNPDNNPFQEYQSADDTAQAKARKKGWIVTIIIICVFLVAMFLMLYVFLK